MTTGSSLKTEHAGAKNGGGYFGRRSQAKTESRTKRRHDDKTEVRDGAADAVGADELADRKLPGRIDLRRAS